MNKRTGVRVLNDKEEEKIYEIYKNTSCTIRYLAELFGVSRMTIQRAIERNEKRKELVC